MKLREYQTELLTQIKTVFHKPFKKLVAVAPTRSGKTVVFAHIASKYHDVKKRVLIILHRSEICDQTIEKLEAFGIHAGQIRATKNISKNMIQVAMVGTLLNRIKKQEKLRQNPKYENISIIEKPDLIIVDECHHSISPTWKEVLKYYHDVPVIGFTATPERMDGTGLIDIFEKLVIGKSIKWMVDNHWLSKPIHLCPPSPLEKANLKIKMGDYDKQAQSDIMKKHIVCADVVKSYKKFFDGKPIIVFCCTVEHASIMEKEYRDAGWNAKALHAKMNSGERKKIIQDFKDGKINQLISVNIVSEGFDTPECYGIQVLRKTKSLSLYLQMFARGLTPIYAPGYNLEDDRERKIALQKGKPESIILDHAGNYWVPGHGSILKDRDWNIEHGKRKEKNEIPHIECPDCHFTWEAGTKKCPMCGHDFSKAEAERKLFEMHELKEELIKVSDIEEAEAESLSKTIIRIRQYKNPRSAMIAILHRGIEHGEGGIMKKIESYCHGLGYDEKYKYRVWNYFVDFYAKNGKNIENLK